MKRLFFILMLVPATLLAQVYSADGRWADSLNVLRTYKDVAKMPRVATFDYYPGIAEGDVPGHTQSRDPGFNPTVGATEEAVWFTSTPPNWPKTARQMACSSSSNSDRAGQIGAVRVIIEWLNGSFVAKNETLTLTGVTRATTAASTIYRINDFWVDSTGSNRAPVGNISIFALTGDTIYRQIAATRNRSQASLMTVPAGKTFYMTGWWASSYGVSGGTALQCEFRVRATLDPGGTQRSASGLFYHHDAIQTANGAIKSDYQIPHMFPAGCDIFIGAMAPSGSVSAIAGWAGWIE